MSYEIQDFNKEVIERSYQAPVLVDFWAEWCAPCRILGPVLEGLAEQANGQWVLAKLNTELHRETSMQYGIQSIPNVKLFVDGDAVNEFVGALPEEMIRQWLKEALPSPYRRQLDQAKELLTQDRFNEAQQLLQNILDKEPDNDQARILLATTNLFLNYREAAKIVTSLRPDSDYFQAAEAIQTMSTLFELLEQPQTLPDGSAKQPYLAAIEKLYARDFDEALQQFIDLIRTHRTYHDDGARKACIAIFNFLGQDHELSQKHRRDFSSALYA